MPNISKPNDVNTIWAATGDIVAPSTDYVANGWEAIIPPREYFNWLDNRQDRFNAHVNQHGIPVWDNKTEYQANLSYSKGSNGTVYRALVTNSNVNPVTDTTGSWTTAFTSAGLQRFTEDGTFTVPSGKTVIYVSGCGGGGGGGGGAGRTTSPNSSGGGGGGGAGTSAVKVPISVTPGQVLSITIGEAGQGGAGGAVNAIGNNGTAGGSTRLGSILTLNGGRAGGLGFAGPGSGGSGGDSGGTWGTDGISGGKGGDGGSGGSGPYGTGGGGGRAKGSTGTSGPSSSSGYGTGGGGGGSSYGNATVGSSGGNGTPGILIIEWL